MLTRRYNSGGFIGGGILIGLGLLFLLAQLFNFQAWDLLWPSFVIGVSALFFIGMFSGGQAAAALAIPGSIIGMIGLTLLAQNVTGYWSSWSYAWTLIVVSVGLGLFISGQWGDHPRQRRAGLRVIEIGLILFIVFGAFFELVLGGSALRQVLFPVLLMLAGLYLIVRRDAWWPVWFTTRGSGQVITETRSVADFQAVSFSAFGDLNIRQGEAEALSIEAEDNVVPEFSNEVRDGTLAIRLDPANGKEHVWPTRPIRLTLTVKHLTRIELSGAGNTLVNALTTDQLEAVLSGAGSLRLDSLDTQQLRCKLSGAGGLTATGKCAQTEVVVSGVGAFHGENLQTVSATVNLSGTGGVTLWVTDNLQAAISGVGSLGYYGHPAVTKNVSGLGSVRSLGDR